MSNTFTKLSLFISVLSLGFSSQAKADMKWVETINEFCPTVCQKNAENNFHGKQYFCLCTTHMLQPLR
jgi:hypothetical protein